MRTDRKSTLVGWNLTPGPGGSNPKRRKSRSKSPSKRRTKPTAQRELKFLYEVGTLGSTFRAMDLGGTFSGHSSMRMGSTMTTMSYTQLIRRRFKDKPRSYKKIVQTLAEVQEDGADKLEIIKRIVILLDSNPDLILGFNAFLPEEYNIEIQDDAVVVKVMENPDTLEHVDTGHFRDEQQLSGTMEMSRTFSSMLTGNSLQYVQEIKSTFKDDPTIYKKFSRILGDYHSKEVNVENTMYEIVSLFQHEPDMVLGFNTFLPAGYVVRMTEKSAYVLEYPGPEDGSREYTKIMIDDTKAGRKKGGKGSIKFKE